MAVVMWNPGPGAFWRMDAAAPAPTEIDDAEMMAAYDGCALFRSRREAEARADVARTRAARNRRRVLRAVVSAVASVRLPRRVRLSKRRRLQLEAAAVGLAFLAGFATVGAGAVFGVRAVAASVTAPAAARPVAITLPVSVAPGDSLWTLARRYGDPDAYILDRVDDLARANGLRPGARLVPGQKLLVPVHNPVEFARLQQNVASAR